ncbi:MAG: FAD-dependent oxidoreductase [Desulfomonile tiedjei]|nr:FAD-dependent oxidoreductase [Desulfomonile tiedjei]
MAFVIIGGDAAGMSAASRAKRNDPDLHVIVLEATQDVSYSACGMPYNVADPTRVMDDLVVRHAQVFREQQGIDLRLGHRVEKIDRGRKQVRGKISDGQEFEVEYDKLLIATGANAPKLYVPGRDLPGVKVVKSLEDGRAIKAYLNSHDVKRVLIIGMGYIGLEMAEAFHTRGIQVEMAKPRPGLLTWMPEEMSRIVMDELISKGIALHFGVRLTAIEQLDGGLKVIMDKGEILADMVLMGVGIEPNSGIAAEAGLELGPSRAIAVDRTLRTSDPDIFAAGDCADAFHVVTGRRVWVPLGLRANRGGWAVGDNVTGGNVELQGIAGSAVFKVLDLEVARTGLSLQEAQEADFDAVEKYTQSASRAHAHPGSQTIHMNLVGDKTTGRLLGASMVGKEGVAHRIDSVAVALHAAMTVEEFFQCDFAYAPPFTPVWDPLLTAANQLLKKL